MTTLNDVARATGRSTATVDRVLNGRPGVREETRRAILKAAADLNYARALPPALSFDFVLPSQGGFMRDLARALTRPSRAAQTGRQIRVHFLDFDAPDDVVSLLERLKAESAGVALVALDHILIREALKGLIARNVPVVTLFSDISSLPHQGYIGIDNRLAGRLAGHLLGRFLPRAPARIAIFTGSRSYRAHEEREMGFRSIIRDDFPHLEMLGAMEIGESDQAGYEVISNLLNQDASLVGLYNIGAGTAGISKALSALETLKKPVLIAHDLSVDTRQHLLSGAIDALIDQNVDEAAERVLGRLNAAASKEMLGVCGVMDSRIIFSENIPQI
jgi:LacI family transcriptional regulator